jgi:hypothetical protein
MSAMFTVQKAVFNAMSSSSSLMSSINNKLYDYAPTNTEYPYITIGMMTETPNNRLNKYGYIVDLELSIYTKTGLAGTKQAKEILEKVNDVLNLKILPVSKEEMVQIYYVGSNIERNEDKTILNAIYKTIIE